MNTTTTTTTTMTTGPTDTALTEVAPAVETSTKVAARPGLADNARLAGWLDLAARGWHLFPVRPGGKAPAIRQWEQRATTDPDRITRFWTAHPDHNAGIACGPSGLLVIDCDMPKPQPPDDGRGPIRSGPVWPGWDALRALAADLHAELPDTWTVTTPSGGRHLYYLAPATGPGARPLGNSHLTLGPLLDTRGHGGQVLAPGSRLPNGGYTLLDDTDPAVLPTWLHQRLTQRPPSAVSAASVRACTDVGDHGAYVAAVVRAELERVAQAGRGGHNAAVFTAARALGQLAAAGQLDPGRVEHDLTAAAVHIIAGPCDCTARDITASIRSGLAHGARRPRHLPPRTTGTERRSA